MGTRQFGRPCRTSARWNGAGRIYATIVSSEKHSGNTKIIWRLDSFGAMDRYKAAMDEDPELARLLDELGDFGDVRIGADFSEELLKSVADIAFWGDHPEE